MMNHMTETNQPIKKELGQSMVELALIFTILMVLLAGTIDLGRAFYTWLAMRDAAQEGASYGSVVETARVDMIKTRVRETFNDAVNDSGAVIDIGVSFNGLRCLGTNPTVITVNVDYTNFPLSMPFLGTILGSQTIPIHAAIKDTVIRPVCTTP
jgi:Flp pilus assembly protein TadG